MKIVTRLGSSPDTRDDLKLSAAGKAIEVSSQTILLKEVLGIKKLLRLI
jgi:hypothetical protein